MQIIAKLNLEEILNLIPQRNVIIKDNNVNLNSARLKTLKKNQSCISCGMIVDVCVLEKHENERIHDKPHINMYCNDILMTVDHIIPQSLGGTDGLHNLQTMCEICNQLKRSYVLTDMHDLKMARNIYNASVLTDSKKKSLRLANRFLAKKFNNKTYNDLDIK